MNMSALTGDPQSRQAKSRRRLAVGLLVAATGILTQYLAGVPGFPLIPPGPIILGAAGLLILLLPKQRWPMIAGFAAGLFVTGGGLIEGSVWRRLADPAETVIWAGVLFQWGGLAAAVVAGGTAIWSGRLDRPRPRRDRSGVTDH